MFWNPNANIVNCRFLKFLDGYLTPASAVFLCLKELVLSQSCFDGL